jgi:hypothetical protein
MSSEPSSAGQRREQLPGAIVQRYLASMGGSAQPKLVKLIEEVAADLGHWATPYAIIRRQRILPLAMSVAISAPNSDVATLVSIARISLWIFALDDLFDEKLQPMPDLLRRVQQIRSSILQRPSKRVNDDLEDILYKITRDLQQYPLFVPLQEDWVWALRGTIDGMIQEYQWGREYQKRGYAMLPPYEEYLKIGRFSIGGPPHIWTALVTENDHSIPAHRRYLRTMESISSTCIRLANDLQSHEKEMSEGKFNALEILARPYVTAGMSEDMAAQQATERVYSDIAAGLTRLNQLQQSPRTKTGRAEASITIIARFVCQFYTNHDFHTFTDN